LFKKSFIYFIGSAAGAILALFLFPLYSRFLTPAEYGFAALIQLTLQYGALLVSLGMNTGFMIRYFKTKEEERKKYFTSIQIYYFVIIIAIAVLLNPIYLLLRPIFGVGYSIKHFFLFLFLIFCSLGYNFFSHLLKNQLKASFFVFYTIGHAVLLGGFNLYFIIVLNLGYWSFFYSLIITRALFALIGYIYYNKMFVRLSINEIKSYFLELVKLSWPVIPGRMIGGLLTSGDRYILKAMSTVTSVGLYSTGYKFGMLPQAFILNSFFSVYNPKAYALYKKDKKKFIDFQITYLDLFISFIFIFFIICSIFFKDLFFLLIDEKYWDAYSTIIIIAFTTIIVGISSFHFVVMLMEELLKKSLLVSVISTISNFILNILLIPLIGHFGAAVATLISYIIQMFGYCYYANKKININYNWFRVIMTNAVSLLSIGIIHTIIFFDLYVINLLIRFIIALIGISMLYVINKETINGLIIQVKEKRNDYR